MNWNQLATLPEGVEDTLELLNRFDQCFAAGFSRLSTDERAFLDDELVGAFHGSPLHEPIADAVARISRSEFVPVAFCSVAAARCALQGALHDALQQHFLSSAGLDCPGSEILPSPSPSGELAPLLLSTQQWLVEIAVGGLRNLEESQITPFAATLEQIQSNESLTGLSALLTGMLQDILSGIATDDPPIHRWADFWSAGMIGSQVLPSEAPFEVVKGEFFPLAADVRIHHHLVVASFVGVFEERAIRVSFSSYKVGVITGDELWKLFRPEVDPFLEALQNHCSIKIEGELQGTGDLVFTGKVRKGKDFDPFSLELTKGFGSIDPAKRHPIHLGQMAFAEDCVVSIDEASIVVGGETFPLALDRLTFGDNDLPAGLINGATSVMGLWRFDEGTWQCQPLAIKGKAAKIKKGLLAGQGILKRVDKLKSNTLEILEERASKLLRERS